MSEFKRIANYRSGDRAESLAIFRMVLNKSAQVGVYQFILDLGPEIGTLLFSVRQDAPRTGASTDFVAFLDRLIKGFRDEALTGEWKGCLWA